MYRLLFLAAIALFPPAYSFSQITVSGYVRDEATREGLAGASVSAPSAGRGVNTGEDGHFLLAISSGDSVTLVIKYAGYNSWSSFVSGTGSIDLQEILLKSEEAIEEVTISSTRTNTRIEDLPVKVEVLGKDELEEEASLVPGGMGSLLGDLSIITIQRTGGISGNDAVRMQGLAPGYTQLLQDGLPLYGGFSGSLGVLNIPPLDLRQVEIIKGSSSTLYGGGAIGGLINFLSKTPDKSGKKTLLFNQTTLGETNADAYFSKQFNHARGLTFFASGAIKKARDINSDGFAEVPKGRQFYFHPRWFWGIGKKNNGYLDLGFSRQHLTGGDFQAIKQGEASAEHPFLQDETMHRLNVSGQMSRSIGSKLQFSLKGAGSFFERSGNYAALEFGGRQTNTYFETNLLWKSGKTDIVTGLNLIGEQFKLLKSEPVVPFGDSRTLTSGAFAQVDHRMSDKWCVQGGIRSDYNDRYGWFVLPRISMLYKPAPSYSFRLGYGKGYKTPDQFFLSEPWQYADLLPVGNNILVDQANSVNMDANYQQLLWDALSVEINQAFYFVGLKHPFDSGTDTSGNIFIKNIDGRGKVWGTDSYILLKYKELELYFGYNHTLSERVFTDGGKQMEPFNPSDKVAATVAWSFQDKWRMGLESAMTAGQFAYENKRVPSYWFWAAMISRQFSWGTIVLNCENLTDERQSRHEALVSGGYQHPVFTPIWGPLEGRVINVSVKWDW